MNWLLLIKTWTWAHPQAFYLFIVVGLILVWSLLQAGAWRKIYAPLMRAAVLALVVIALAGPEKVVTSEGKSMRPVVVDLSNSITPAMRDWSAVLLRDKLKLEPSDPAVMFGRDAIISSLGQASSAWSGKAECSECKPDHSDLEVALRVLTSDQAIRGGAVVVITDGWENQGNALQALAPLVANGTRLDIFTPPGASDLPNVAVTDLTMPRALASMAPFALSVTLRNLNPSAVAGTISVYQNDKLIDSKAVTLDSGEQRFDFPVRPDTTGLVSYRAAYKAANPATDVYPEDDSRQSWLGIGAKRRALILSGNARDSAYLLTVAKRLGLDATALDLQSGRPFDGRFNGYDAVILNNVARDRLSTAAQAALAGYVEHGGALAMVGGDRSFGLGGYEGSDIAKVMPVVMKPPEHKERSRALLLVIDKSGSMGRDNKLTYAKAAARSVTKSLNDNDMLGVIGFDSQPFVVVPLARFKDLRGYFDQLIDRLKARGTTYLMPALKEANRELAGSGASVKHLVILTDGETGGTAAMYYDLIASMHRDGGVTISTIAIGRDPNMRLLASLSKFGGGSTYQTDSPQNLPEIFLEDFKRHGGETTLVEKDFTPQSARPDALLKELAGRKLPAIKGYVGTLLKPRAALDVFVERQGRKDPIIASWRYGQGKALAVTTDASGRWSSEWIRANLFTRLWDNLLGWMAPGTSTVENFDVALGYQAGRLHIKLTDYSAASERSARLISAMVAQPGGNASRIVLSEDVPGEMSGSIEAPHPGVYYIELKSSSGKGPTYPPLAYTVSPAATAELPRPEPNYGLLEHLASATGGRLNPSPDEIKVVRPMLQHRASLSPYFLLAAMLLLIAEALVRRLTA